MAVTLTPALAAEYRRLFTSLVVRPQRQAAVEGLVDKMAAARPRYEAAAQPFAMPWAVVAVIHSLETSLDFTRHLHNGDPLTRRTVQVPAGRPLGPPPFTWEVSAEDALRMKRMQQVAPWTLAKTMFKLEQYNGFGYRLRNTGVLSPYLWSFSTHYSRGKFVRDGEFSPTAVSAQAGAAVLLRRMAERGLMGFADEPLPTPLTPPLIVRFHATRPTDPETIRQATLLQEWLTTHSGIFVRPDGWPGEKTSDAFKAVTGRFLPGDPRG
jgi:lysozyme family protein